MLIMQMRVCYQVTEGRYRHTELRSWWLLNNLLKKISGMLNLPNYSRAISSGALLICFLTRRQFFSGRDCASLQPSAETFPDGVPCSNPALITQQPLAQISSQSSFVHGKLASRSRIARQNPLLNTGGDGETILSNGSCKSFHISVGL